MYDRRDTDYIPTKSGVIGMLAAALGRKRDEAVDDLSRLKFGIRVDRPGARLEDFQITYMGEKLNANLANKVYLSDAVFLAGLSYEDKGFLKDLEEDIRDMHFFLAGGLVRRHSRLCWGYGRLIWNLRCAMKNGSYPNGREVQCFGFRTRFH
jgi:hypothetical protein